MFHHLRALLEVPGPHPDARRPGPEGAVPRLGARVLLVVLQPAAPAAGLHVRLHGGHARRAPRGHPPVRPVLLLRHPAVDLVQLVADRVGQRAHLGRQPDQEGAVPGRGAADRRGAGQPGALLPRPADPRRVPDLLPAAARSGGAAVVPGDRLRAVPVHHRAGAAAGGADRALPRHQGPARQPADAVVLLDADHLLDADGAGELPLDPQPQPDDPPGDFLPGGAVPRRPARPLEVAAGARRAGRCSSSWPATSSSTARIVAIDATLSGRAAEVASRQPQP